jgi:hypothetical protein
MLEEMEALKKNKTWELVELPLGKDPMGCKWVYTQTYGIDYEETFAHVAKMKSVRVLISCAANCGWNLHQLDVKNAFLHGDLQEEIYMHISSSFETNQTKTKLLRLYRSLYGLNQSPRAWFDRFRKYVLHVGYNQSNADHTLFYKRFKGKLTILIGMLMISL